MHREHVVIVPILHVQVFGITIKDRNTCLCELVQVLHGAGAESTKEDAKTGGSRQNEGLDSCTRGRKRAQKYTDRDARKYGRAGRPVTDVIERGTSAYPHMGQRVPSQRAPAHHRLETPGTRIENSR